MRHREAPLKTNPLTMAPRAPSQGVNGRKKAMRQISETRCSSVCPEHSGLTARRAGFITDARPRRGVATHTTTREMHRVQHQHEAAHADPRRCTAGPQASTSRVQRSTKAQHEVSHHQAHSAPRVDRMNASSGTRPRPCLATPAGRRHVSSACYAVDGRGCQVTTCTPRRGRRAPPK